MKSRKYPRLCIVGPLLGKNPGWVVSNGEILAKLFTQAGYTVMVTSTFPNRALRVTDTISSLITWRREVDLVILMVFSGRAFIVADVASLLAERLGKPLVLWLHGGNLPNFASRHPHWVNRVLCRGTAWVAPSNYLSQFFRKWGFDVMVIPNVLEIDKYAYRQRHHAHPRLLWMRTFHELYHPEMAIEVLAKVKQSRPETVLTMAGQDKGLLKSARYLAKHMDLDSSVRFVGFLDLADKRREFAAHDVFLNTNRVDNMPVSVVEAAAFGLPVVATAVGGIPYLLRHEKTALLVEEGDVEGMAEAILRLFKQPSLVARLSANGRSLAEASSWSRVKEQWERLLEKVLLNA